MVKGIEDTTSNLEDMPFNTPPTYIDCSQLTVNNEKDKKKKFSFCVILMMILLVVMIVWEMVQGKKLNALYSVYNQ